MAVESRHVRQRGRGVGRWGSHHRTRGGPRFRGTFCPRVQSGIGLDAANRERVPPPGSPVRRGARSHSRCLPAVGLGREPALAFGSLDGGVSPLSIHRHPATAGIPKPTNSAFPSLPCEMERNKSLFRAGSPENDFLCYRSGSETFLVIGRIDTERCDPSLRCWESAQTEGPRQKDTVPFRENKE